jgi:GNAT superfamily N-acetyltransferase
MTSDLFVPEEYRRNGIATRLLKAGLALAKSEGVGLSMSHIESPFALMARLSIFGEKGLTLCDDDKNATPVDLTFDEALTMLERDEREYGFVVESNLNDIDTSDWELPIMKTKPV